MGEEKPRPLIQISVGEKEKLSINISKEARENPKAIIAVLLDLIKALLLNPKEKKAEKSAIIQPKGGIMNFVRRKH